MFGDDVCKVCLKLCIQLNLSEYTQDKMWRCLYCSPSYCWKQGPSLNWRHTILPRRSSQKGLNNHLALLLNDSFTGLCSHACIFKWMLWTLGIHTKVPMFVQHVLLTNESAHQHSIPNKYRASHSSKHCSVLMLREKQNKKPWHLRNFERWCVLL